MSPTLSSICFATAFLCAAPVYAQDDENSRQVAQERKQAETEAPQLAELLGVKPGATIADIGTGGSAMAIVLGRLVGAGRVYATDVTQSSLTTAREYAKKEGLTNRPACLPIAAATAFW
jgi:ubiquinone/menaquinone biosynthesis C-methylase UbiE